MNYDKIAEINIVGSGSYFVKMDPNELLEKLNNTDNAFVELPLQAEEDVLDYDVSHWLRDPIKYDDVWVNKKLVSKIISVLLDD